MTRFETFQDILNSRYSCRAFLPEPLGRDRIEAIAAAAQKVPSWCNAQPWQLIITDGDETEKFRQYIYDAATSQTHNTDIPFPGKYEGIYKERRRSCGFQLYDSLGIEKGDRAASARQMLENYNFFGAPHIAIVTTDRALGEYGILDCGGFITGFTLAAAADGVATIPQAAIAAYSDQVRSYFDIPEDRAIVCGLSMGLSDEEAPVNQFRTDRATPAEVIAWRG